MPNSNMYMYTVYFFWTTDLKYTVIICPQLKMGDYLLTWREQIDLVTANLLFTALN